MGKKDQKEEVEAETGMEKLEVVLLSFFLMSFISSKVANIYSILLQFSYPSIIFFSFSWY